MKKHLHPLTSILILCTIFLLGSAVEKAPVNARSFEFNTGTTNIASGADTTFSLDIGQGSSASVLIANDNANSTDSDLLVAFNALTAPAPSSTAASTTFRLKPGNMVNFDGRWNRCTLRGATGTCTARVIATY